MEQQVQTLAAFLIVESMCSFHFKSADRVTPGGLGCFTLSVTVPLMVSGTNSRDFEKEQTIYLVLWI